AKKDHLRDLYRIKQGQLGVKIEHLLEFYREKQEGLGIKLENILEYYRDVPEEMWGDLLDEIKKQNGK
ncbi:MAG: hypothetical protein GXX92_02840, partial [Clostridiales bacterium]|nr:hypothetical protein [Clostridiales bacterium]